MNSLSFETTFENVYVCYCVNQIKEVHTINAIKVKFRLCMKMFYEYIWILSAIVQSLHFRLLPSIPMQKNFYNERIDSRSLFVGGSYIRLYLHRNINKTALNRCHNLVITLEKYIS